MFWVLILFGLIPMLRAPTLDVFMGGALFCRRMIPWDLSLVDCIERSVCFVVTTTIVVASLTHSPSKYILNGVIVYKLRWMSLNSQRLQELIDIDLRLVKLKLDPTVQPSSMDTNCRCILCMRSSSSPLKDSNNIRDTHLIHCY